MNPPVAIIRAAGWGTRMGEITRYFQKCALPIDGRPLIVHWVEALLRRGISDIHIVWGHLGRQVIESVQIYEEGERRDGRFTSFSAADPRNGIWKDTRKQLELFPYLKNRPVLLCYADNYSPCLDHIIATLLKTSAPDAYAVIGLIPTKQCSSMIQKAIVEERPGNGGPYYGVTEYITGVLDSQGWAWAGIALFPPDVLEMEADDTVEILSRLTTEGRLAAIHIEEPYYDIQTILWGQENG